MNREIKFRAFDEDDKVMYHTIDFEDMYKMTIMQFTGLHDKNGKEIYEGDVVEVTSRFIIIWSKSRCRFMKHKFKDDSFYDLEDNQILLEVIGNIHENPELLNN